MQFHWKENLTRLEKYQIDFVIRAITKQNIYIDYTIVAVKKGLYL